MGTFVWTKMGVEAGERLEAIIARKEAERQAGKGEFWWGIGSSLGPAVHERAKQSGGTLPVVFSAMRARPKSGDAAPAQVWRWTAYEGGDGRVHNIPSYAKVTSKGADAKDRHYALVCQSDMPLALRTEGRRFDAKSCRTLAGKLPGPSQVTALLEGDPRGHQRGDYEICFRATLVEPWAVKLLDPVRV